MSPTFKKLKKSVNLTALIVSLILGVSCGLFVAGAMLLVSKLIGQAFAIPLFIIGGSVALAVTIPVTYLIFRKSDKALAKSLDKNFKLNEKVQTMVEFSGSEDAVCKLQRIDAENKLQSSTGGKLKQRKLFVSIIIAIVSVALALTSFLLPSDVYGGGNKGGDDPPYAITQWQLTAMRNLIDFVEVSQISEQPKAEIAEDLSSLLDSLCSVSEDGQITTLVTEEQTNALVCAVITKIDTLIEEVNTYKILYNSIRASDSDAIKTFAIAISKLDTTETFIELREFFTEEDEITSTVLTALQKFGEELSSAFNATEVSKDDTLLIKSDEFATSLCEIATHDEYSYDILQNRIDNAFNTAGSKLNDELGQQKENRTAVNYVILELIKIFEVKNPPEYGGEPLQSVEGSDGDGEKPSTGGAPGEGGTKYGSDDEIYYPDDQKYLEYGEILDDYDSKKDEIMDEIGVDDTLESIIDAYFQYLYGSAASTGGGQQP